MMLNNGKSLSVPLFPSFLARGIYRAMLILSLWLVVTKQRVYSRGYSVTGVRHGKNTAYG